MYKNPKKVYPNWVYSNPDSPLLKTPVKVFATLVIFMGSFTAFRIVSAILFAKDEAGYLALPLAFVATWFLRPRLPKAPIEKTSIPAHDPGQNKGFLTKNGKSALAVTALAVLAIAIGVLYNIRHSEACELAIRRMQSNPITAERLGEPLREGFFVTGSINVSGPSGHADLAIPISGPKGKATLYVVADKSAGLWKLGLLQLAIDGDANRIDLLEEPSQQAEPIQHSHMLIPKSLN